MGEKYKREKQLQPWGLSMMIFPCNKVFHHKKEEHWYTKRLLYMKIKALKNFGIDSNGEIVEKV